jgi:hypothetical protein
MSDTTIISIRHTPVVTAEEIRSRLLLTPDHEGFRSVVEYEKATIPDTIDFTNLHTEVALVMRGCVFEKPVNLTGAKFPTLALTDGCRAPSIDAKHIVVEGDVRFDKLVCGTVNLAGAHITDDLHVESAHFSAEAPALDAANARIGGGIMADHLIASGLRLEGATVGCEINLTDACLTVGDGPPGRACLKADALRADGGIVAHGLKAKGQVRFVDLQCASTLELSGAQLSCETPEKTVLYLDRAHIAGSLYCNAGFATNGVVQAIGVDIGGSFYLKSAHLTNGTPDGESLILHHARIGVQFSTKGDGGRFTADGRIDLDDAHIAGKMQITDADLIAHNGPVLTADRAQVGAGVTFKDVTANSTIKLNGAHITCDLDIGDLSLSTSGETPALELSSVTVDKALHLRAESPDDAEMHIHGNVDLSRARLGILHIVGEPPTGITDLTGAHATLLLDEQPHRYLEDEHQLVLNGFTYDQIHMSGVDLQDRLRWLQAGTRKVRAGTDHEYHAPPHGFVPQPYEQLAAVYRSYGQMRDARIILLHKNRARTRGMQWRTKWPWRILGIIQDIFVGYGYAPGRAFAWILALYLTGVGYFAIPANHPRPTEGAASFTGIEMVRYPMDLLLPGIGVGGKSAWTPTDNWGNALAFILIIAGWLLGITIVAGIARALKRD